MSLTSAGSSSACAPASGEAAFIAPLQAHRLSPRSSNLRLCWRIAGARARLAVDAQHTLPKLDTSLPDSTTAKAALTTVVFARAPLQDWTEAAASCAADHFLLNETSSENSRRAHRVIIAEQIQQRPALHAHMSLCPMFPSGTSHVSESRSACRMPEALRSA